MTAALAIQTIPTFAPIAADETAHAFGLRAFGYLVTLGHGAALLDTEALELAQHASLVIIRNAALLDGTRETFTAIRREIAETLARRHRDAAERAQLAALRAKFTAAPVAPAAPPVQPKGGPRVPVVRPRPLLPSAGASAAL
jgi:hypothetical protein